MIMEGWLFGIAWPMFGRVFLDLGGGSYISMLGDASWKVLG